jgi:hypothetical protein
MKKVQFNIHYRTAIGESLFIKIKELETGKVLKKNWTMSTTVSGVLIKK